MLLLPINTEKASLKSELQSRDVALSALQTEVAAVKSPNAEPMSEKKNSRRSYLIPRNSIPLYSIFYSFTKNSTGLILDFWRNRPKCLKI